MRERKRGCSGEIRESGSEVEGGCVVRERVRARLRECLCSLVQVGLKRVYGAQSLSSA